MTSGINADYQLIPFLFCCLLALCGCERTAVSGNFTWPLKRVSEMEGDIIIGGLMMVHERQDDITCGPIMTQVCAITIN